MNNAEHAINQLAVSPNLQDLLVQVRQAWAEVLDVADAATVPLDANFLEAGGNSLLLIMLWEHLHGMTRSDLKVADLFQHSTVRAQARLLAGQGEQRRPAVHGAHRRDQLLGRARRDRSTGTPMVSQATSDDQVGE